MIDLTKPLRTVLTKEPITILPIDPEGKYSIAYSLFRKESDQVNEYIFQLCPEALEAILEPIPEEKK